MRKRIRINDWGGTTLGSVPIKAEHEQRLTKSLLKDNRIDDLKRALDDPAFARSSWKSMELTKQL